MICWFASASSLTNWYQSPRFSILFVEMTITKFDIEKFDRSVNFGLWKVKMRAMLIQNGCEKALLGKSKKPVSMTDEQFDEIDLKAMSAIQLCLSNEVLREVMEETTAAGVWLKLESLYMTKNVTNRLILRSKLHDLRLSKICL